MAHQEHHLTFFRQSGWMMVAAVAGGALMSAVHIIASRMPKEQYGVFATLLQVVAQMGIPAAGLQGIFAQQAAASLNPEHERELAGMVRGVLRGTFFIWLIMAAIVFALRDRVLTGLGIANATALWLTVVIGLLALWRPLMLGVVQGRQIFLWFGWASILEGAVRFGAVFLFVGVLAAHTHLHLPQIVSGASGAMSAVLIGYVIVLVIGVWFSRDCLWGAATPMDWTAWLRRVVPLTLGLGVSLFMLGADLIFVQNFFSKEQTPYYAAAGVIGRALVYFTVPLTAVMFPKIVRSAALGEKSYALTLALGITALAGGCAAMACTVMPSLPLRIVFPKSYLPVSAPLVPWFAWCMLPLTLSNVLINSLMARSRFKAVPWLVAVAVAYAAALYFQLHVSGGSFRRVIQTLGIFNVLLLAVCAWFSFHHARSEARNSAAQLQG